MSNQQQKKLFVKLTKNPTWGFTTEDGARHTQSFDKSHPKALDGMLREILQMTYHHYGVKKAGELITELSKGNADYYKDLNP